MDFTSTRSDSADHSATGLFSDSPGALELRTSRSSDSSAQLPRSLRDEQGHGKGAAAKGLARHTLGLVLLLVVVFLWTTSNFLGSTIFANRSYAKPFFLTYLNTAVFVTMLFPVGIRSGYRNWRKGILRSSIRRFTTHTPFSKSSRSSSHQESDHLGSESESFLAHESPRNDHDTSPERLAHLDTWSTARLAFYFCILWFCANYFALSCLQYTTVASTTILTSTASMWTLLIGAITRTEKFTWRKMIGVLASLVGVFLISQVDLSTSEASPSPSPSPKRDQLGDSFPEKSPAERAFGDAMAAFSAFIYGVYTITLKRTTNSAAKDGKSLNMPLFFGLVGLINTVLLLPVFPILSVFKIETFELPPTRRIWTILLVNSLSSLLSDVCWAYAMVLTSPLVVTVGLSLTIPLSLVGELIVQGRSESFMYWIGAIIVVLSFVFVDREEVKEERDEDSVPANELSDRSGYTSVGEDERRSGELAR